MPLRVNHNITAMNTRRQLLINNRELSTRIERLSSGLRINRAADDDAELSVSEGMRAQIVGLQQAVRNAEHGTNLIQTAEGALNEVSAILIRMRELSVQSASSSLNNNNRQALNAEVVQLISERDRISGATSYNDTTLLRGFGKRYPAKRAHPAAIKRNGVKRARRSPPTLTARYRGEIARNCCYPKRLQVTPLPAAFIIFGFDALTTVYLSTILLLLSTSVTKT